MRTVELKDAHQTLADCARDLGETVVVTRRGKPLVAVVPVSKADLESLSLATNPDFLALLERSRARYRREGGISHAEVRTRLGLK